MTKKKFVAEKPANDNEKSVVTLVVQPQKTDEEKLFEEYLHLISGKK